MRSFRSDWVIGIEEAIEYLTGAEPFPELLPLVESINPKDFFALGIRSSLVKRFIHWLKKFDPLPDGVVLLWATCVPVSLYCIGVIRERTDAFIPGTALNVHEKLKDHYRWGLQPQSGESRWQIKKNREMGERWLSDDRENICGDRADCRFIIIRAPGQELAVCRWDCQPSLPPYQKGGLIVYGIEFCKSRYQIKQNIEMGEQARVD
ncbi:hypothetical protein C8R44DRAFT_752398 [Mycena epipterygia]|nr:hypothetical protein C8R44DRAFT_752398 [Mycena epipterygia]